MDFFDEMYQGVPPWDIGRPQQAVVRLAEEGRISGSVLDVGCGTGENALYLAARGHDVWAIDAAPLAIEKARYKAHARRLAVVLLVADALDLGQLGRTFDTVLDCGLFHVFSDDQRPEYTRSLGRVLRAGGDLHVLCWSDREPLGPGPRRVSQREIRETFRRGWHVDEIVEERFESLIHPAGVRAWRASMKRLASGSRPRVGKT